jgi:hypothetical protein
MGISMDHEAAATGGRQRRYGILFPQITRTGGKIAKYGYLLPDRGKFFLSD